MNSAKVKRPSELQIDRYIAGELSNEERTAFEVWMAQDAEGGQLVKRRKAEAESAGARVPTFADLDRNVANYRKASGAGFRVHPVFAAVLAVLIVVPVFLLQKQNHSWQEKGSAQGYCLLKRDTVVMQVKGTFSAREHDTIQVYHVSEGAPWVMLLYAEGQGTFSPCVPGQTNAVLMPQSDRAAPLPFSMVIDSTQGLLVCALVTAPEQFSAAEAIDALSRRPSSPYTITIYRFMREHQ